MELSTEQIERVRYLARDKWVVSGSRQETDNNFQRAMAAVTQPEELHQFALNFNWDCGFGAMRKLVHHPLCDLGTALLIYHMASPGHYYFKKASGKPFRPYDEAPFEFVKELEGLILKNGFSSRRIGFDPKNICGLDFTKKQGFDLLPAFAKEPVEGARIERLVM